LTSFVKKFFPENSCLIWDWMFSQFFFLFFWIFFGALKIFLYWKRKHYKSQKTHLCLDFTNFMQKVQIIFSDEWLFFEKNQFCKKRNENFFSPKRISFKFSSSIFFQWIFQWKKHQGDKQFGNSSSGEMDTRTLKIPTVDKKI